ncbi:lamin tail domain-containing protein [Microbacterium marinilacus]|uniref:LTD domain-containing protein n=1 Tax=Microbacterium marinilacus TaxID=415209 RepID=A0ABP7BFC2_9MICO|nr:lamin tail domain-containing protein [Microbacterium marinilacus]MBY0689553.1 lamin tail domain-containing protein [Microbacterium marinilacus]
MQTRHESGHPRWKRARALTATGIGLGMLVPGLLAAPPALAADGFTDEQLNHAYTSNTTASTGSSSSPDPDNWSIRMMDVFNTLRVDGDYAATGDAAVMQHNEDITVEINTTSSDEQHQRAIVDQYGDMALTMADGLGERLGAIYAEAWEAGELPKTRTLLSKDGGRIGYNSSTNPPKNYFDYDRPYLALNVVDGALVHSPEEGGKLRLVDRAGGDAWASTSGAFPSGHTSQAYWQGTALATMLPELAPQILARTAEAGDNRIVMGAHWALDVIGGRMMGQAIVQLRWADPEFAALIEEAAVELRGVLEAGCGAALDDCIASDTPYLGTDEALAFYEEKLSYDFPLTGETGQDVVVPEGAESLLASSRPELTADQRRQVLALTAIDSGNPLDEGEEESWQRLNLAAAMTAEIVVNDDGSVSLADGADGDVLSSIRINEVESNGGEPADWIELTNIGDEPVDISGLVLKDDNDSRTLAVSVGVVLDPGAFFVVQVDDVEGGFGLGGADSARVFLADGVTLVDSYSWTAHATETYGRLPDGTGEFVQTASTRGEANVAYVAPEPEEPADFAVVVNEVESNGDDNDWVELFNTGAEPVDISGYTFIDGDASHEPGYVLPAGSVVPAGGFFVLDEKTATADGFDFGLGGNDSATLRDPQGVVVATYSWTAHAAVTYGRNPDGTGEFADTTRSTKGAPNDFGDPDAEPAGDPWPGGSEVRTVDPADLFAGDLSGLDYEAGETDALWAVNNGEGLLYRLVEDGDTWDAAQTWTLRYANGTGTPDAEGVTIVGDSSADGVYVATERDNAVSSVSRPTVLQYDVAGASGDLAAVAEWDLTADFPGLGANAGLEGITWIPDDYLVENGFEDATTGRAYDPEAYPLHGDGLFFVGVEGTKSVYAYALNSDGTFQRLAEIGSGLGVVAEVQFDAERGTLWVVADEADAGRTAEFTIVDGAFASQTVYARPAGMANIANEGFAIAPAEKPGDVRAVFWADDADTDDHSLRAGTVEGGAGTEEPGGEEPGTAEPGTEEPGAEQPGGEEPGNGPGTDEPGTDEPGAGEPGATEPGTEKPGTDKPGTTPGTDEPGAGEPGTDEPGTDEPGASEPGEPARTDRPGAAQPGQDGDDVPQDGGASVAPSEDDLNDGNRGGLRVLGSTTLTAGGLVTVVVDAAYAGQTVFGWLFSEPTSLGQAVVASDGSVTFRIPDDVPAGAHRLVVTDADGTVIGWVDVTVRSGSALVATGGEAPFGIALAAALLLVTAGTVLAVRPRRAARR